ncbi:MAG: trypsin-like peptidase domain-containing protein [Tabrizicola sp.]|uniref:S1C family serine protease n=1 Tax=Tabrizicola sp. TaxID=2005166 RepID=UPI0027349340|nr:trypsin-like peptidase domain-containing protein [Tabrizicola sp.]MDP3263800.1 trypsin-like peptidase domain-containing protein [Tabrizicola sp.]MDP3647164.1 trypsin-like peptidase domain-containing protein [Paracoccaceae bacterium]MDZ4067960.1 trypsin-like peptidase domain-containing protein [Tabrizicola sp.]
MLRHVSILSAICGVMLGDDAAAQTERCKLSAEAVFEKAGPKVVEIFADAINPFRVRDRMQYSLGTGFLFGDGVIVTNYHVIADAQRVDVYDGEGYWGAQILGIDPLLDIAVLSVPFLTLTAEPLDPAPSGTTKVGQDVFAIGFPRGIGKTITHGIVTGTGRVLGDSTSSWLSPFVQTDATVNPGNSGGPLLDDCARVIGLVSRASAPGEAENIAFALPVDVLAPIVKEIATTGHVARAWHGLYGQMVEPAVLSVLGIPPDLWDEYRGFLVETIEPGSAADEIGLKGGTFPVEFGGHPFLIGGDIITEVNGVAITDLATALDVVRNLAVGSTVTIVYKRGADTTTASVILKERPIMEADLDQFRQ